MSNTMHHYSFSHNNCFGGVNENPSREFATAQVLMLSAGVEEAVLSCLETMESDHSDWFEYRNTSRSRYVAVKTVLQKYVEAWLIQQRGFDCEEQSETDLWGLKSDHAHITVVYEWKIYGAVYEVLQECFQDILVILDSSGRLGSELQ